jgi:hypothetical protein
MIDKGKDSTQKPSPTINQYFQPQKKTILKQVNSKSKKILHPSNENQNGVNPDILPNSQKLKKSKPENTKFHQKASLKQSCLKFDPKNKRDSVSESFSSQDTQEHLQNKKTGKGVIAVEKINGEKNNIPNKIPQSFCNNIDKFKMSTVQKALFYKKLENCYEKTIHKVDAFRIFSDALTEAMSLHLQKEERDFCQQMIKFCLMRFVYENSNDSWHKIYKPLCSKDVFLFYSLTFLKQEKLFFL